MSDPEKDEKPYEPPDLAGFLTTTPLYGQAITLRLVPRNALDDPKNIPEEMPALRHLLVPYVKIDALCPACGQSTIYSGAAHDEKFAATLPTQIPANGTEYYTIRMVCSRVASHHLVVAVKLYSPAYPPGVPLAARVVTATKIGMFPSLADLQQRLPPRLAKVLGKKGTGEFNKGVGLVAHGIGIGAFVYLRRIFEDLIEEVAKEGLRRGRSPKRSTSGRAWTARSAC